MQLSVIDFPFLKRKILFNTGLLRTLSIYLAKRNPFRPHYTSKVKDGENKDLALQRRTVVDPGLLYNWLMHVSTNHIAVFFPMSGT